jgi:hypothetical protein
MLIKKRKSRAPVVHAYNNSCSGGRDRDDQPGQIVLQDPISKNPSRKRAGGVAQVVDTEFKPQYCKEKRKSNA